MNVTLAAMAGMATMLFTACTAPVEETIDTEKLKVEIQAMEDAFAAAEKAKDADAVAAYYSDDAVSYTRNEEPTQGKAAIRDRVAKRLATDTSGHTNVYKVVDLYAVKDMAVEVGSWTEMDAAGAEVDKGFYLSYFQKKDGKYLCVRDMNISTMPAK
jgi:uncharacterized protein (TIGR02246 family)